MEPNVVFHVTNKQSASSGTPPEIDGNTPHRYHSYFENAQGEQLIFIYNYESDQGTLYHGDLGQGQPHPKSKKRGGKPNCHVLRGRGDGERATQTSLEEYCGEMPVTIRPSRLAWGLAFGHRSNSATQKRALAAKPRTPACAR